MSIGIVAVAAFAASTTTNLVRRRVAVIAPAGDSIGLPARKGTFVPKHRARGRNLVEAAPGHSCAVDSEVTSTSTDIPRRRQPHQRNCLTLGLPAECRARRQLGSG
jgi:hypothetical protein